eukprot:CAMPEP_0184646606 /NCGR_PEP_ID=MMETSP0308-20130426/3341_1 /TAXON_ID=38269 /ORGANISM="Gloeochaete witrockiana, Strain SAG 46.84" /LENGTH=75 /DNA_ID=CAMNT_0027076783 /DNA_START=100 /DNA_END=327 /DNA_ORIENTATION=+
MAIPGAIVSFGVGVLGGVASGYALEQAGILRFVPKTEQAQRDELSSIVHEADELSHSGSSLQTAIFLLKSKLVRH